MTSTTPLCALVYWIPKSKRGRDCSQVGTHLNKTETIASTAIVTTSNMTAFIPAAAAILTLFTEHNYVAYGKGTTLCTLPALLILISVSAFYQVFISWP